MDSFRRSPFTSAETSGESLPLVRPMSSTNVGSLCFAAMLSGLALLWCVVDRWNHSVSDTLFGLGNLQEARISVSHGSSPENGMSPMMATIHSYHPFPGFNYPLFVAFMQFAFMGLVFLAFYWVLFRDSSSFSWNEVSSSMMSDRRWPALVLTHIFSTFWLQALMMPVPARALSLGLLAATRAVEIPFTAILRAPLVGVQLGPKTAQTAGLACAAAIFLYCSYAQVAKCLCVWSGHGVTLYGPAFWIIYILVLLLPATNTVLQEGVMQWSSMHPVLMLSLMNLCSCLMCTPLMIVAHLAGWEDVSEAFVMIFRYPEAAMLVVWLALQMALIATITVGIILMTDSFWAVTLRSLRVVYWWVTQIWWLYTSAALTGGIVPISMSISCPSASKWSFVMLCGFALAGAAIYTDRKAEDTAIVKANHDLKAYP